MSSARMQHGVSRRQAVDKRYRGGDLFVRCGLADGTVNLFIADVSSKGRTGIVHAEMLWNAFMRLSMIGLRPAAIIAELNALRFECRDGIAESTFASAFVGRIDPVRSELLYASAGHELALLFRGRAHRHLDPTGPVLGVFPDATYADVALLLTSADVLLLATDGVTEARHASDPKTQFGTTGLVRSIDVAPPGSAADLADRVMCASEAFCGNNRRDDATVAVLSYNTREYIDRRQELR
jgi:sigma-B regulation protein RsbU (phosphoserine phosphatase)